MKLKAIRTRESGIAFVLGADVNALGHIRSLARFGIPSYAIWSGDGINNVARISKYCLPVLVSDSIAGYETNLINKLISLGKTIGRQKVLYATSDYFVAFIDANRKELQKYFLFNIPKSKTLSLITDKYSTNKLARQAGLRTPRTIKLQDHGSANKQLDTIPFPCIIKPQNSYSYEFPAKNIVARNEKELTDFLDQYPSLRNHIILQEIISGDEKNIYQCTAYIGKEKKIQQFTMQKYHQSPPGYGVNSLGRSVTVPPLMRTTEKLLKDIGYTGFASIEYKKSDKDNQFYLIEINPRLPWYNSLFEASGVNFAYLAYLDLVGEANSLPLRTLEQKDDVYWISLKHELSGVLKRYRNGSSVNTPETIRNILRARSFAFFDPHDLKPCLMANIEFLNGWWKNLSNRKRRPVAS